MTGEKDAADPGFDYSTAFDWLSQSQVEEKSSPSLRVCIVSMIKQKTAIIAWSEVCSALLRAAVEVNNGIPGAQCCISL